MAEVKGHKTVPEHPLGAVLDSFDQKDYGGAYLNDDCTVTLVTQPHAMIQNKVAKSAIANMAISYRPMQYSYHQLLLARDKILGAGLTTIESVGTNAKENAVAVFCRNLSQKQRQEILDVSPVKNVVFFDDDEFLRQQEKNKKLTLPVSLPTPENTEFKLSGKDVFFDEVTASGGIYLYRRKNEKWSTLAYFVALYEGTPDARIGFLTSGHGCDGGQDIYVKDEIIGTMNKWDTYYIDAGVVEFDANRVIWQGVKGLGHAECTSNVLVGAVCMSGATTWARTGQLATGEVVSLDAKVNGVSAGYDDSPHIDFFAYDFQPQFGDSGATMMQFINDGTKTWASFVGINICQELAGDKPGKQEYTWGAGCKWTRMRDGMQLSLLF